MEKIYLLYPGTGLISEFFFPESGWPVGAKSYRIGEDGPWEPIPEEEMPKTQWPWPGNWSPELLEELRRKKQGRSEEDAAQRLGRGAGRVKTRHDKKSTTHGGLLK